VSTNGAASYQLAGNAPGIEIEKQNEGLKAPCHIPDQQNLTRRLRKTGRFGFARPFGKRKGQSQRVKTAKPC